MFSGVTSCALVECLSAMPPMTLLGVELLRELRPITGQMLPVGAPADKVLEATLQMIRYADACAQACGRLQSLLSVPLLGVSMVEFCL